MNKKHVNSIRAQGIAWIEGKSIHNEVRDECTPDFSCCQPALFEKSKAKRIEVFNRYALFQGQAPYKEGE